MSKKEISQIEQEEGIGEGIDIEDINIEIEDEEQISSLAADEIISHDD